MTSVTQVLSSISMDTKVAKYKQKNSQFRTKLDHKKLSIRNAHYQRVPNNPVAQ